MKNDPSGPNSESTFLDGHRRACRTARFGVRPGSHNGKLGLICNGFLVVVLSTQFVACSKTDKPASDSTVSASVPSQEMITRNNRGVGLMGQFKYAEASQVFAELHEQLPDDIGVTVNLAIARLNEQGEESVALATQLLDEAVAKDPQNVRANYCRGLLRLYAGEPNKAIANFEVATNLTPDDAFATYLHGLCLEQTDQPKAAGTAFERALELDPYFASAVLGLSRVARQAGDTELAKKYITDFQRLQPNPYARVFEFKYKAMGRLGEAWAIGDSADTPALPEGKLFAALQPMQRSDDSGVLTLTGDAISFVDLEGDHDVDLVLTGAPQTGSTIALVSRGNGKFATLDDHPLGAMKNVRALLHGDIDNNSKVDHVVIGDRAELLLHNDDGSDPNWSAVSIAEAIGDESEISDARLFDADHDGDLDLYCIRPGNRDVLINNNRNGSYRALGAEFGLDSGTSDSRQVVTADFDNDRDLDLLLIKQDGEHILLENDRLWQYATVDRAGEFRGSDIDYCVAGDLNLDGMVDVVTLALPGTVAAEKASDATVTIWHGEPDWRFKKAMTFPAAAITGHGPNPAIALRDLDGDGTPEILIAGTQQIQIYNPLGELKETVSASEAILSWGLASFDASAGPTLVIATETQLWQAAPGPGRNQFVTLSFGGQHNEGDSLRSNFSGIGTRWRARAGTFASSGVALPDTSGPGQSLQPTQIGLGGQSQLDTLEIVWPDGVFQSELALSPGALRQINETQRQLSSCPVLFAWNGMRYDFVTDLMGVGGIGFLEQPGSYGTPRPLERILLSTLQLAPQNGRLALKLGEPMEEACYLDHVTMQVVDIPDGWSVTLDERAGVSEPLPTSELIYYRDASVRNPVAAVNDRGMDMLEAIARTDGVAADVGEIDERFIGLLTREHSLTIRFDPPLQSGVRKTSALHEGAEASNSNELQAAASDRKPVLLMHGWIEYPYSQTNFAAWQAGVQQVAPSIDARSSDGNWVPVLDQFGFPAGMPRAMSVPLAGLPDGTTELRVRTNLEVYWDQISVAYPESCPDANVETLPLAAAELARVGFAARETYAQRRPYYDYSRRSAAWDTRHQPGDYTRFGDVGELLAERDNALAIFGPGEEVHFEFQAAEIPPPVNANRLYLLSVSGWCKDMDLYTRDGDSLEPLPFDEQHSNGLNHQLELHRKYNTRYEAGK